MGTPVAIEDVITIPETMVEKVMHIYRDLPNLIHKMLGVAVDCVYGQSRTELVNDLKGKGIIVGGATAGDLVGTALGPDDLGGRDSLPAADLATRLMTVVLAGEPG